MATPTSPLVREARQLVKSKDYKAAITTLRYGLEKTPEDRTAQEMLGVLLFRFKRVDEATEVFRQLTRLDPRDPGAWVNLGAALNSQKDYQNASDALRKAIQRDKNCAVAYYNLAIAQQRQNQPQMAISAFEECIRLEPDNTEASINLANILIEQKNYRKASRVISVAQEYTSASGTLHSLQQQTESGLRNSRLEESPFGRLVDEEVLARSQRSIIRRKLSRGDRNREREFMRDTAKQLRHAVRPMVTILDNSLPKQMHILHMAASRQDSRNEAFDALESFVATVSELASMKATITESADTIRTHVNKTDPGV
ncbi:MAG: tetratricopeptide repeat protein [Fuerstiella sp.]|nr:tetratricopeptide repeat protein [Fuerstiella sp.]